MKKIVYLLLAFTLLFVPVSASAENSSSAVEYENLKAIGITFDEMNADSLSAVATRAQLAYIASKLSDGAAYEKANTVFGDVTDSNSLSGYIKNAYDSGILNGKSDSSFAPDEPVTTDALNKVFATVAGYSEFAVISGGYPMGYKKAVGMLGLKVVPEKNADGNITVGGLLSAADEFLAKEYNKFVYSVSNGEVSIQTTKEKTSALSSLHKIDIYEGEITDIEPDAYMAKVNILSNIGSSNNVSYSILESVSLKSVKNINLYALEGIKVKLWVNEDRIIVNAAASGKTEVKFLVIASVNGDSSADSAYSGKYIDKISFEDDNKTYSTAEGFKVKFNFELTQKPVNLTGKYARVIFENQKPAYIEAWDLKEGGLVNEVGDNYIKYTQGENPSKRITELDKYTRAILYSDSKSGNLSDIKLGTYFDYYEDGESLIVIASEKRLTDELKAISDKYAFLGNGKYELSDTFYVKDSAGIFRKNGDVSGILNETASVYVNAAGKCVYIEAYENEKLSDKEFTGIILGSVSDEWEDDSQLKIFSFTGNGETKIYTLKEKCTLPNDKTKAEILAIKDDVNADYIFKFILNDKNEIIEIAYPDYFYYYGNNGVMDAKCIGLSSVPYQDNYLIPSYKTESGVQMSGSGKIYVTSSPIKVLLEDAKGELYLDSVSWSGIYGQYGEKIDIHIFGDEYSAVPSLILICGGTNSLSSRLNYSGFVTDSYIEADESGEKVNKIELISSSTNEYKVDSETMKKLGSSLSDDPVYISFKTYTYNNENEIKLEGMSKGVKLSSILENPAGNGFSEASVLRSNEKRVYFYDGKVEAVTSTSAIFRATDEGKIERISATDISDGEDALYISTTDGITILIVK